MDTKDPKLVRKIRNWTIHIDRSLCIGSATCVSLAPNALALDNEAKAVILDSAAEESDQTLFSAAKGCPVSAITIMDETGKKIVG